MHGMDFNDSGYVDRWSCILLLCFVSAGEVNLVQAPDSNFVLIA